jgi:Ras-related protein Rab-21
VPCPGALLVYDITDADSFNKVKQWVKELRKMVGNDIQIAVAGNKYDLEKNRTVSQEEAIKYAQRGCTQRLARLARDLIRCHSIRLRSTTAPSWSHCTDALCRFVQSVGGTHHNTSAKTNKGINEMFLDITKRTPPLSHIPAGMVSHTVWHRGVLRGRFAHATARLVLA